MLDEFVEFLGSFKNTESLSSDLRRTIQVAIQLEEHIVSALLAGRDVLITGSAGSGKTHALQNALGLLPSSLLCVSHTDRAKAEHVTYVEDATELTAAERLAILETRPRPRRAAIMAINEGPLREAADLRADSVLHRVVELMHSSQRGAPLTYDPTLPVIVDMAAFDPLDREVLTRLLALPLLGSVVDASPCGCLPADCPRRLAWRQLQNPGVLSRVADVVRLARLTESEWLFRDVWDFIADLVLEGRCNDDPPSSPWFWRLFYGASRISSAVREIADPTRFAMPGIDTRIHFADWNSDLLGTLENTELIPVSQPHTSDSRFAFAKAQIQMLTRGHPLSARVLRQVRGSLPRAVFAGAVGDLLRAINQYMHFGLKQGSSTKLDLIVDHSVRRAIGRASRGLGMIRLGEAPAEEFEVRSSRVITNHADAPMIEGNRKYLVHVRSGASFELSPERLRLLEEGRSVRLSDRDHVDLAWDLSRFFEGVLPTSAERNEITINLLDFARLQSISVSYRINAAARVIEVVE